MENNHVNDTQEKPNNDLKPDPKAKQLLDSAWQQEKDEDQERLSAQDSASGGTRKEESLSEEERALRALKRKIYSAQYFNSVLFGFILVIVAAIAVQSFFTLNSFNDFLSSNQSKISNTLTSVEGASKALEQSSKAVQEVSEAQNKLLTDVKTQENIGVLLRQADDVARLVKNANIALNQVNREILPSANKALDASTNTINQAGAALKQTETTIRVFTSKGEIILDSSNESIRALEAILQQPNLKVIVDNLAATSAQSIETVRQLNISAEEINKALPELLTKLNNIGNNTDLTGKEITTFLQGVNKPKTRKQKLFRALIQALIISAPYLSNR